MNSIFSGSLKIDSLVLVSQSPAVLTITGKFKDNTGQFSAGDIRIGDVIYIRSATPLRFVVQSINQIYKSTFVCTVAYDLPDTPVMPTDLSVAFICRRTGGILFIPNYSIQQLPKSFIDLIKLTENLLESNLSIESSTTYVADKELTLQNLSTNVYIIPDLFVLNSLEVYINGLLQTPGQAADYVLINNNEVHFNFSPHVDDLIMANYLKF